MKPFPMLAGAVTAVVALALAATSALATTVRVGTTNSSSDAPLFIAAAKGYFKTEGLEVEFTSFDSAAKMIAPLGTGQLEVGAGSPAAGFYNAVARGLDVRMVADKGSMPPGYGYLALMVRRDLIDSGKVKSIADLKGMKFALPAQGTTTDSTLNEAIKKGGLKWNDIEVTYMGFPQHVIAFQNKAIDASVTTEPSATRAEQLGAAVRYMPGDVAYPNQQVAVILYGGKFIKDQPEIGHKFMKAYIRAVRDYNDALKNGRLAGPNANEIIKILTEYTTIKDPKVYASITPNGCNPDGKVNEESLKKDLDFFRERGLIQGNVTVEQVIDHSFVAAAIKELGTYKPKH
ncbi:MAG TPA: ABC transporter substrate-binding protein [Casimicrobiaceae bacterium]|nr:ABC transporter substrate-binding protein [Casimicrobiaceae bacterium]